MEVSELIDEPQVEEGEKKKKKKKRESKGRREKDSESMSDLTFFVAVCTMNIIIWEIFTFKKYSCVKCLC